MRRSIFKAGAVTVFGLAIAFAIVSANSNTRHAATAAPATKATVATAPASTDECTSSDVCCARETKAVVAAAPKKKAVAKKAAKPAVTAPVANGMVVAIDESGTLTMPSAEQMLEMQRAAQTQQIVVPAEPVREFHLPNGLVGSTAVSEPTFATIRIDATGRKILGHGDLTSPLQPATPALEEK